MASKGRWIVAVLAALGVWAAASSVAPPIGANTVIGPILAIVPGIIVAGLIVGARSARSWVTVALVVAVLALAISVALVMLFLGGL